MPSFLIEIGVEELPAFAVAPALEQFRAGLLSRLSAERLPVPEESVQTFATPRRLSLRINDALPERQRDAEVEARGPSAKAAYDAQGAPTKALIGFAAKQGVPVESITTEGDYVVARRRETGQAAGDVLCRIVPEIIRTLTFPKFLRWGEGNFRFGRPLRRIVALLDNEIVPIELEGIRAGRETPGHRYTKEPVTFANARDYEDNLRQAYVEVNADTRRQNIVADAERLAKTVDGIALLPENLLTENVFLTEWTTGVLGNFDAAYLNLPRTVLTTSMAKNQRFFPVEDADGNILPHFIAIRNGDGEHLDKVRAGYEGVLASRFNDANFFFEKDRQTPLSAKLAKTGRIVFQEKLGTLEQKTQRLLSAMESTGLLAWTGEPDNARRAVTLSKADLASEIVAELTSLQGVMGREFARMDGESEAVAVALYEQYLPKSAGDELPTGRIGTVLSLADRVDTLTGYMMFVGAEPKGSSDPFGLKRAANAIIELLARDETLPSVRTLFESAVAEYEAQGLRRADKPGDMRGLLESRIQALLEERGVRLDAIESVFASLSEKPAHTIARAELVQSRVVIGREMLVAQPGTRIRNILRSAKTLAEVGDVNPSIITQDAERDLWNALQENAPIIQAHIEASRFSDAVDALAALESPVNAFFDNVMVMDEDDDIRNLRLALLVRADAMYMGVADFSKITAE